MSHDLRFEVILSKLMDMEIYFKDLSNKYGVKKLQEPGNKKTALDSFVQSGINIFNEMNPDKKLSEKKSESIFFDSMKAKVAILNQLMEWLDFVQR